MLSTLKNYFYGKHTETDETGGHVVVEADPLSQYSTKAWDKMKVKGINKNHKEVHPMDPKTPITEDKVRFVCISDTHATIEKLPPEFVPDGDVLLHAGDLTNVGKPEEVRRFNEYLGTLPHKHKVVIAGNHDLTFDKSMDGQLGRWRVKLEKVKEFLKESGVTEVKDLLTNCIYLEDSMVTLYGINIYGSPWQPWFGDWGFNLTRGEEILEKWDLIPECTDILITHGPPVGYGDMTRDGNRAGCVDLLNTIQKRVKPLYHISGHIHEGYGVTTDGFTTYINASTCTLRYKPDNPPVVFDFPIPKGHTKQEVVDLTIKHFGDQQKSVSKRATEEESIEVAAGGENDDEEDEEDFS